MDQKQYKSMLLSQLYAPFQKCTLCPLGSLGRKNVVFGSGNPDAEMLLIGEGPGREEDEQGLPFVGRSGKLLTKILESLSIQRKELYIANVVKCRPPNNRAPLPNEVLVCKETLLEKQIDIIKPKVICTLGASALNALLGKTNAITKSRGTFTSFKGIPVLPAYHPAYILRSPKKMPFLAQDLQTAFNKTMAENVTPKTQLKQATFF